MHTINKKYNCIMLYTELDDEFDIDVGEFAPINVMPFNVDAFPDEELNIISDTDEDDGDDTIVILGLAPGEEVAEEEDAEEVAEADPAVVDVAAAEKERARKISAAHKKTLDVLAGLTTTCAHTDAAHKDRVPSMGKGGMRPRTYHRVPSESEQVLGWKHNTQRASE